MALIRLAQLPEGLTADEATADARDLPDEVQYSRREIGDSIKIAIAAAGEMSAAEHMLHATGHALGAWGSGGTGWQAVEASMYALNALSKRTQTPEVLVNVLSFATACMVPHVPKLAGTALTLLGGLAQPLGLLILHEAPPLSFQQPSASPLYHPYWQNVQTAFKSALALLEQTQDAKLSRNAATAVYRLSDVLPVARALEGGGGHHHLDSGGGGGSGSGGDLFDQMLGWYRSNTAGLGALRVCIFSGLGS